MNNGCCILVYTVVAVTAMLGPAGLFGLGLLGVAVMFLSIIDAILGRK